MVYLNEDVLFQILEDLNDKKSIYSCLLVNKTWCITAVSILWRNPGQYFMTNNSKKILFNVIFSHLSKESRNLLKKQVIDDLITETSQRPLFNYISFWKYLNFFLIENIITLISQKSIMSTITIRNEILKLFINGNTKFLHLSIPRNFNYQLHYILGVEHCFSEIESLSIYCKISQNILELLARTLQEKLNDVSFIDLTRMNKSLHKSLEESLIKHADTIQYLRMDWLPYTRILSYLVNLLSFEIDLPYNKNFGELSKFRSFQIIKNIKGHGVPPDVLANLIESTKIHLSEISIYCVVFNVSGDKRLIQTIYQNCPNLRYLKLSLIIELNHIKLFLDNWKDRNPMLLKICTSMSLKEKQQLEDLIEPYKAKGIIKNYFIGFDGNISEKLEWI
ncbi:2553_t:CDS:2 [Rhizophagus irregularis]|nr:2553_t:CDS:2 [Rhizophagus irregularis]